MPRIALTARNVLAVEARPGRYGPDYWWDSSPGAPPAFGVRVTPDGVRTYVVDYRVNGRTRRQTLGRADVLLLSHARELARDALRRLAAGEDPGLGPPSLQILVASVHYSGRPFRMPPWLSDARSTVSHCMI
jgi:hypothetical protein